MNTGERLRLLKKILVEVRAQQDAICEAVRQDSGRSEHETHIAEIVVVKEEIKLFLKNLRQWTKPVRLSTPFQLFPASSYRVFQPLGSVLVLAPWNFPFHLSLVPAVGALAAGNRVIIKPSPLAPASSALLAKIVNENIASPWLRVEEGDAEKGLELIRSDIDLVFFTGSSAKGAEVYREAAAQMRPVVLELGGKNPLIFHKDGDTGAVNRIVWGKSLNAGQTCLSPDYAFVHTSVLPRFYEAYRRAVNRFYGEDVLANPDYPRVVNRLHFDRLKTLLESGTVITGGKTDAETLKIEPTLIELPVAGYAESPWMREEIFGPVLPVIAYMRLEEILPYIAGRPAPLAVYVFSNDKSVIRAVSEQTASGALSVNDCLVHGSNPEFAFGGVGMSGIGKYHGYYSLQAFSNTKSILKASSRLSLIPRFPPYTRRILALFKRM